MARQSPMRRTHYQAEASLLAYGAENQPDSAIELVGTFGELELEYAALRKNCILLDQPQRGLIELTGKDRLEFLNRMVTQEIKGLAPFRIRRTFWLNKKGRVDADIRIIDLPRRTMLELDALASERTRTGLAHYVISEDVKVSDRSEPLHRLSLHGPTSLHLLMAVAQHATGADASGPAFEELLPDRACVVHIAGAEVIIYREDSAGEMGLELIVPVEHAAKIYALLIEAGREMESPDGMTPPPNPWRPVASRVKLRPAGWHAYNIARIEAGTPLYNIDFGAESLPAESGVIDDRVSFTKGCYLGQEIVARMHSRGHPKQALAAVKFDVRRDDATQLPIQPESGAQLFTESDPVTAIGAISSSTLSPMLGSVPVALASIKWGHHEPGTTLVTTVAGGPLKGTIQPTLTFWSRGLKRASEQSLQ
ncbi:Aminomethyltransferase [Phycisphaerales bacterium]|nr:Aminomethyltransferase [Phycisphaerales bacterium]